MENYLGSCLCGQVQYEISGRFDAFFLCHCGHCRKDTGSAHAANLFSSTAILTWLQGKDALQTFQLPETRHARCFCSSCGSALPYHSQEMNLLAVPAGSLDSDVPLTPNAHIFMGSKAHWDEDLEQLPKMDSFPSAD